MSAHVLLNLLNELGKRDKMRGLPSILSLFRNEFNSNQPPSVGSQRLPHESWLLLRLDMLFSVTYPTHFYILGHNFSTVKATSGYWSLEVVSGVFPH